jgi:opacity protein-like surface antigen
VNIRLVSVCLVTMLLFVAAPSYAQSGDTAVAFVNTPVYIAPDSSRTPLRFAAQGTTFQVLSEEEGWTKVRFQDPQWGPREGYVASKDLRFRRAALEPMDLSVRPTMKAAPEEEPTRMPTPPLQPVRVEHTWPKSYVVVRSGLTFGTQTAPLVGVEVGGNVARFLQAYGSFDWHRDISPSLVDDVGDLISDLVDADVNFRFPSYTLIGGAKLIAPHGMVRPYGLGGFGYGRVSGTVEIEGEDVTGLLDEFDIIDRDDINFNKALFEVGGGVSISNGPVYVDVGYRFRKFLQTGAPINVSGVYAGVGVGF